MLSVYEVLKPFSRQSRCPVSLLAPVVAGCVSFSAMKNGRIFASVGGHGDGYLVFTVSHGLPRRHLQGLARPLAKCSVRHMHGVSPPHFVIHGTKQRAPVRPGSFLAVLLHQSKKPLGECAVCWAAAVLLSALFAVGTAREMPAVKCSRYPTVLFFILRNSTAYTQNMATAKPASRTARDRISEITVYLSMIEDTALSPRPNAPPCWPRAWVRAF